MQPTPEAKPRGRPRKSPAERTPPRPRSAYGRWVRKPRPPEPVPTPEQLAETRALMEAWALAGGWPAPRPGWQSELARRLGVRPPIVSLVWCGRRCMPGVWRGRMAALSTI